MDENKKRMLKEIIKQLHSGVPPEEVKDRFRQVLEGVSSEEIAKIENELVKEGMPREEIQRLCNVHLAVFREQLEKQEIDVPIGHPVSVLMEEHKIMLQLAEKLVAIKNKIRLVKDVSYVGEEIHNLEHITRDFTDSEKHYLREENVLFPLLEKHGVTEPPAIMWIEHNQIREKKKQLSNLVGNFNTGSFAEFKTQLAETAEALNRILSSHFYKENSTLFPMALRVFTEQEWMDARREFDEIGYCCFTPSRIAVIPQAVEKTESAPVPEGLLQFETGSLSKVEIEAILNALPVDISFVDADDAVRYFNKAEKRIFVRTKAVIGRKVQFCHPQKSVLTVNKILEAFKSGEKGSAEFWITTNSRLVHIKYFAVRDKDGKYLRTMEVTQDLTDIKKIEGQRRLLDWKD
jgi:DUF438 domain-containing protein